MTLNQLIDELREWSEDRGHLEVRVVTPNENETGPVGEDATVLSVGGGTTGEVLLLVGAAHAGKK